MRVVQVAAAAVAGVAVLAGCSGGQTANETLPSTSASVADASARLPPLGPPDLPMPDEAREQTPAGAEAFLEYYVALINDSQQRSSSEYLRRLAARDCDTCTAFADGVDSYRTKGYSLSGGLVELASTSDPLMHEDTAEFFLSLRQAPSTVVTSTGDSLPELAEGETSYPASGATLVWDDNQSSWLMSALTIS